MADLRRLVADLGYVDVRTLLNSGNVVLTAPARAAAAEIGARIESAVVSHLGITSRVIVLTARDLRNAIEENPLVDAATNASRHFVAVLANPRDRKHLEPLTRTDWSPDAFAIGTRVAYLWCPRGMLESRLPEAVGRALGDRVTTRNWATILRIHEMLRAGDRPAHRAERTQESRKSRESRSRSS